MTGTVSILKTILILIYWNMVLFLGNKTIMEEKTLLKKFITEAYKINFYLVILCMIELQIASFSPEFFN